MTEREGLSDVKQAPTNLNSREAVLARLRRGRIAREKFVESHLAKTLAHQIRATRGILGWSQEKLASEVGMNQNAISRLESPHYGRPTLTTLKRVASAMDIGLVVRFVRFSELVDWVSGTPRTTEGLSTEALAVPSFVAEYEQPQPLALGAGATSCVREKYLASEPRSEWDAQTIPRLLNGVQMSAHQMSAPAGAAMFGTVGTRL